MFDDPRWGDDPRDRRDDEWQDRDDDDSLTMGRGPSLFANETGRADAAEVPTARLANRFANPDRFAKIVDGRARKIQ